MEYVIFIIGLLIGSIITYFITRKKTMGVLKFYESDEPGEKPYMFVELDKPVSEIRRRDKVCFKISLK